MVVILVFTDTVKLSKWERLYRIQKVRSMLLQDKLKEAHKRMRRAETCLRMLQTSKIRFEPK